MMSENQPAGVSLWIAGARPRTLPAAIVPVAVGAAAAVGHETDAVWWRAALALVVSLALQIGVNYANDYSDGIRGTDDARRVGPLRLVGSGLAEPAAVKRAATAAFAVAVFGGALGCGLLLLKRGLAFHVLVASLLGTIVTRLPLLGSGEASTEMWIGWSSQVVINAFLVGYVKRARTRGWIA